MSIIFPSSFSQVELHSGAAVQIAKVFQLQKKTVRIMTGNKSRISCKPSFKASEILTLPAQHILTIMTF